MLPHAYSPYYELEPWEILFCRVRFAVIMLFWEEGVAHFFVFFCCPGCFSWSHLLHTLSQCLSSMSVAQQPSIMALDKVEKMWRNIFLGIKQYTVKRADIWHVCARNRGTHVLFTNSFIFVALWRMFWQSSGRGPLLPELKGDIDYRTWSQTASICVRVSPFIRGCIRFFLQPYLLQGFWLSPHPKPLLQQWSMHGLQMAPEGSKSILLESFPCSVFCASFSALFLWLNGHKMPRDHFDNGACPTQKTMSGKHLATGTHKLMYNSSFFSSLMYRHPEIHLL